MTMRDDDNDLREIFARSRSEERLHDDFAAVLAAASSRRSRSSHRHRAALAITGLAAAIVVAVFATRKGSGIEQRNEPVATVAIDLRSTRWKAPTDFLLVTPGNAMLHTLPTLRYDVP
jgi:hypothetical protein